MYGTGYGYYGFDGTYLLIILGLVITLAASARVKGTFNKFSRVYAACGMTGAEAAQRILQGAGIYDVRIEHISGSLTDHYDPTAKALRLSDSVYGSSSVAAIGVAAHECGHAIQHDTGYQPLAWRSAIVPVANIGSRLAWPVFLAGILLSFDMLLEIGIILFLGAIAFQVVTLPVEFNASNRAIAILGRTGMLQSGEIDNVKKVLGAAAMTYVASLAASLLQLLRLLLIFSNRRSRR